VTSSLHFLLSILTLLFVFQCISITAIIGALVSIVIVIIVIYTKALPTSWNSFFFNGTFLIVYISSIGLYFGRRVRDICTAGKSDVSSSQLLNKKPSRNIERSFLEMVRAGYGLNDGTSDDELLHELVLLIGILKKAHTPEAKLRLCNDHVTQWKNMLMLINDGLVSISYGPVSRPYVMAMPSDLFTPADSMYEDEKRRSI
jgi:hypothetical protein